MSASTLAKHGNRKDLKMATQKWQLPVEGEELFEGISPYTATQITTLNRIVEAQTTGALDALGSGVIKRPATSFQVTAATGRDVTITAGMLIARHSVDGPCVLRLNAPLTFGPLEANRGSGNPIYLFAAWERTPLHNSLETNVMKWIVHDTNTYDGGVLLATIETNASSVVSIVDSRSFIELGGSGGSVADGSITLVKLATEVLDKFSERPTSIEVDDKIAIALDGFENDTLIAGENITISDNGDGTKTVAATGDLTSTFSAQTVSVTTETLSPNESETVTVTLGRYAKLARLQSNAPAWVRLYPSEAAQVADAGRTQTEYFQGDRLVFDYLSVDGGINALLEAVDAFSTEAPRASTYPLTITNSGAVSAAITVDLQFIRLEL
jgi:hypothetical protein